MWNEAEALSEYGVVPENFIHSFNKTIVLLFKHVASSCCNYFPQKVDNSPRKAVPIDKGADSKQNEL
jgi:hypothetical protein